MSLCVLCLLLRNQIACIWLVSTMLVGSALRWVCVVLGNSLFKRPNSELRVMTEGAVRSNSDVYESGGYCEEQ